MKRRGPYAKGQERRDEILRAAVDVISREGYRGASLSQIGRSIGIDSAHIIYYFSTREMLLQEVLRMWDEGNAAELTADKDVFAGLVEGVRRNTHTPGLVQLYTAFAAEAVDASHPAHEFFRARFAVLQSYIADEIRRRQAVGSVAAAIDADHAAMMLIAKSDGLQVRWLVDRSIDMAAALETEIELLLGHGGGRK
ncbi:AcrR family transcriptional regulator [Sphingobium sp. OAS761]|uniref:TetR/AcrR family transcriptional regulator n=1 Tax=Sphingobium sp. OAS761 TaxID=2817901 RepID=UPI00209FB277|nr:TetR/AcrR family transcriptional regulator [Sphingobium sp. OAS761]MCP1469296.1 AcrR family transcriptional regulator [Sphingobium sp. OAS761]